MKNKNPYDFMDFRSCCKKRKKKRKRDGENRWGKVEALKKKKKGRNLQEYKKNRWGFCCKKKKAERRCGERERRKDCEIKKVM